MPVPTEKEKKGSFFYFASIFLREKQLFVVACVWAFQTGPGGRAKEGGGATNLSIPDTISSTAVSVGAREKGQGFDNKCLLANASSEEASNLLAKSFPLPLPHSLEARETSWEVFSLPLLRTEQNL